MTASFVPVHPTVVSVTERIIARSRDARSAYLERIAAARHQGTARSRHGCANLAHGFAHGVGGFHLALEKARHMVRVRAWIHIVVEGLELEAIGRFIRDGLPAKKPAFVAFDRGHAPGQSAEAPRVGRGNEE